MKVLFSKHIHSNCSAFSSSDKFAHVYVDSKELDFSIKGIEAGGIIYGSKNFQMLNGLEIDEVSGDRYLKIIYFKSDKTFYNKHLSSRRGIFADGYENTDEFKELISSYETQGWSFKEKGKRIKAETNYFERERIKQEKKDKEAGLVLWQRYEKRVPADYQGGFSDGVFNSTELKSYVDSGMCFGWVGHLVRHPEHDKLIESGLRERGLSDAAMYNWISSSDGRNFGDSLTGYSLPEQLEKIKKYLNSIFNLCLIYGSDSDESYDKIRADYQAQGFLLPEDNTEYDPNISLMMLASVLLIDKEIKGNISPSEKMISDEIMKKIKGE